MSLIENYKLV